MYTPNLFTIVLAAVACVSASPVEIRANNSVNPAAIKNTKCTNPNVVITDFDKNRALLAICGGIPGKIQKCQGAPKTTSGIFGGARFDLSAATAGATINISKGRWEGCVRAARAACPTGELSTTCVGGGSKGDVNFKLVRA